MNFNLLNLRQVTVKTPVDFRYDVADLDGAVRIV